MRRKMEWIAENLQKIKRRIAEAARRAHRNPKEIILIGATKGIDVPRIRAGIEAGLTIIGENYIQEAKRKYEILGNSVRWHFIGHLQTNKVKYAIPMFEMIQTVDSVHLAKEIDKRARNFGKPMEVLIEVNTSGEETKFGVKPEDAVNLAKEISSLESVKLKGLMTLGFFADDPEEVRPCFRTLRHLFQEIDALGLEGVEMKYLSMGMTNDFEVAIEEGANMVRIGTGIFGPRG